MTSSVDGSAASSTRARPCTRCGDDFSSPTKAGRHRHQEGHSEQALCLTIVTNAVVLWNTVYLNDALEDLRREANVDDEVAAHLSSALVDHINPYGRFLFDVDRELTRNEPSSPPPSHMERPIA